MNMPFIQQLITPEKEIFSKAAAQKLVPSLFSFSFGMYVIMVALRHGISQWDIFRHVISVSCYLCCIPLDVFIRFPALEGYCVEEETW